jgi:hypothetical protein
MTGSVTVLAQYASQLALQVNVGTPIIKGVCSPRSMDFALVPPRKVGTRSRRRACGDSAGRREEDDAFSAALQLTLLDFLRVHQQWRRQRRRSRRVGDQAVCPWSFFVCAVPLMRYFFFLASQRCDK